MFWGFFVNFVSQHDGLKGVFKSFSTLPETKFWSRNTESIFVGLKVKYVKKHTRKKYWSQPLKYPDTDAL